MKERSPKPRLFVRKGGVTPSGTGFAELLRAVLDRRHPVRFCAGGASMNPTIRDNDVVTVTPLRDGPVNIGDVVACVHPQTGNVVVHRVIARNRDRVLTRGDNARWSDGLVNTTGILGRVARVERNGRETSFGLGPERYLLVIAGRVVHLYGLLRLATSRVYRIGKRLLS